jgi:hypothetical protein
MGTTTSTALAPERLAELGLPDSGSVNRIEKRARHTFQQVEPELEEAAVPVDAPRLLDDSARVLEQLCVVAALAETADNLRIETFSDFQSRVNEVFHAVRLSIRTDPIAPFEADPNFQEVLHTRSETVPDPGTRFPIRVTAAFVRAISSLVEFCPIDELVRIGEASDTAELGHRCRISHDWLRAFVRRHRAEGRETLHIIGRAYSEGRLTLDEAANLLGMPRPDAVAWLEEHGHARDVSVFALAQQDRVTRLQRMRADRLARGGRPVFDERALAREVLATQRIEGVDARPWVRYPS